jgi:hypothetical protein
MGTATTFTKQLAAASANNIATSQSISAGVAALLNGSASNYLSTTSSAALAAGGVILPVSSTTGVVVGQSVTDTTTACIPSGTVVTGVGSGTVTLSKPVGGASGVGSGDTIVFAGTAIIDTATAANVAIGRRVVVAYTGTDCNWAVVGTNSTGNVITDTIIGASGAGQSNLDFVTVTSVTPVGSVTAATVGTNGVGSSPWVLFNWRGYSPMNVSAAVELISGAVNFTVQYTYDDPNNPPNGIYPLTYNLSTINGASATADGAFLTPIKAARVLINSGTGEIRTRFVEAGVG